MGRNRVVVLDNGSLIVSGLLSLLREHAEIECVAVREDGGDPEGQIRSTAPDVIVLAASRTGEGGSITLARLLEACPRARIVALSVERPGIEIIDTHRVERASVADFLTVIVRGRGSPTDDGGVSPKEARPRHDRRRPVETGKRHLA